MELQAVLDLVVAFLKAIAVPVASAAVVIAFLIDHVAKRLPFWKDGYAGYVSLALNILFSAGLFAFAQYGKDADYLALVEQAGVIFTLLVSIGGGFVVAGKAHDTAYYGGVGKSVSAEHYEAKRQADLAAMDTIDVDAG